VKPFILSLHDRNSLGTRPLTEGEIAQVSGGTVGIPPGQCITTTVVVTPNGSSTKADVASDGGPGDPGMHNTIR
jgi:hypothetical protein